MKRIAKIETLLLALSLLGGHALFAAPAFSGERIGNGGDIRRFRSVWALRWIRETADLARALDTPNHPACTEAIRRLDADRNLIAAIGDASTRLLLEWVSERDGPLPACANGRREGRSFRVTFSYEKCPKALAPQQIVVQIIDLITTALGKTKDDSDAYLTFANSLRKNECFGNPYARSPDASDDDLVLPGEIARPGILGRLISKMRDRTIKQLLDPKTNWSRAIYDAGFDPQRISIDGLRREIAGWISWKETSLSQCAETEPKPGATIYFSPPDCGDIRLSEELRWILLHETAHHYGVKSEADADRFAQIFTSLEPFSDRVIRFKLARSPTLR